MILKIENMIALEMPETIRAFCILTESCTIKIEILC